MKLNIDQTLQISDEQRVQMADVLDEKQSKRQATRAEMKDYIWTAGATWETTLKEDWENLFGSEQSADEDLIGGEDADDDEDLI